ncbi:MAG TPA: polysaccharide pyruvyl transferase CsaB, partial [Armatimonadota bacterium]|nr:polysaccharide pyruvyl transferase CsaB [Armatimonadota bacterium]
MSQILLSGYYGFNNIGDEAVLGGLLAGFRAELPDVTPVVLSADPEFTRQLHGVDAVPRMSRAVLQAELQRTALLISGGGSLLQDVTSFRSPLYYLWVLWEAQRANVPTMMCAQGVGPLNNPVTRLATRMVLNRMKMATVRDAVSADFLHTLGVEKPPIEVTADPSFLLTPDASTRLNEWWSTHIPANRPVIGVALRHWAAGKAEEKYTAIADALAAVAEQTNALILFIPMQFDADTAISEEMAGWTPAENRVLDMKLTPREMLALVERCDFLVAMRLHALIFAVHRGTPAFGISYDPKVRDFSTAANLPTPFVWDDLDTESLSAALQAHWEKRVSLRATLTT